MEGKERNSLVSRVLQKKVFTNKIKELIGLVIKRKNILTNRYVDKKTDR